MNKTPTIEAQKRDRMGTRYARRLRQTGRLPAVLYGHKAEPLHLHVDEKQVITHLRHGAHLLSLEVAGEQAQTCLVKDLQYGFLGDNVVHVDFTRVDIDEEVRVQVALHFVGTPALAAKTGAILSHDLNSLEVICRAGNIPEGIRVDLSRLGTVSMLTVGELALPPGVRTAVHPSTLVAHVMMVEEEVTVGEAAEVVTTAEPEVIGAKVEEPVEEAAP